MDGPGGGICPAGRVQSEMLVVRHGPQQSKNDVGGRHSESDSRPDGGEGRVGHHVMLQWLDEGDARVFASATAVRNELVVGLRLEGDAEPLDSVGITRFVEEHSGNADA